MKQHTRVRMGGGSGRSNYCKNCTKWINHYEIPNKTPNQVASIVPYSTLANTKLNCYNFLIFLQNNKKRVPNKSYYSAFNQLIPQMEKIQKAMQIQIKDNSIFKDIMYNDMMKYRINKLVK